MIQKIILMISIFIIAALSGCVTGPNEKITISEGLGPEWCKTGTKITSSGPQGQGSFEIKGTTTYNGKEVCQAEYIYDQGGVIQYFNEKGDYMVIVYKDKDGKVIREINVNNSNP